MTKEKKKSSLSSTKFNLKNTKIQRILIAFFTLTIAFIILLQGATPKKYRLTLDSKSEYDITAPRDVVNTILTEQNAIAAAEAEEPVMKEIRDASIKVINKLTNFLSLVNRTRNSFNKGVNSIEAGSEEDYHELFQQELEKAASLLKESNENTGYEFSEEQIIYIISEAEDEEINEFENVMLELVSGIMVKDVTKDNIAARIVELQNDISDSNLNQELKNIGIIVSNYILEPNRKIDDEATKLKKEKAYNDPANTVIIEKGQRILSVGDTVTKDKLKVLEDLNLLETKSRFDYSLAGAILIILVMLSFLLVLYMNYFCKKVLYNRNDLILLSILIITTLFLARWIKEYTTLLIPVFLAVILVSILLDVKLALMVNLVLTIAISIMTNGEIKFIFMALISGTFSIFLVSKANQRNKLTVAGAIIGLINVLVVIPINLMNKAGWRTILENGAVVLINGFFSTVFTIGLLPTLESTFNVITPMRLLELGNPNHPLLKRLLTEAPGTYHHSLMVGNLAEAGAEAIGGNPLLARVGAYFHDVGKLKRPGFFTENQMSENPHDKMTPNLSALVITSHVTDGVELAKKYKIPLAIIDIILQHHGTTLVAYFYHKAKNSEKGEEVDESKFRYEGKKPRSKEAAVVMLADSVEAAVRSMPDKTEGKIEGLIRKIIKDKLEDGQFDHCDLTLKDLDSIAKSFMKVFGGYFHNREEYPEIKKEVQKKEKVKSFEETAATKE
ncbi:HD family phosphohydrolase [Acetivibrio saccincola]|jgi:putative nucleotidyltransferase with HDIG domain|uniref:7TM receptor with intracellular HD hydrolase n=1 Tax=Acetivibrio saccincola TaxID=1677857 RepID=A0A2K9E0W6_9FIRM|nr:HDIG domain-containing metalloprotein [Acetivibrio saccincola]AUG57422.1 7TM receptor with intracellular HD hydrolase [Acetivibrio saccincola]